MHAHFFDSAINRKRVYPKNRAVISALAVAGLVAVGFAHPESLTTIGPAGALIGVTYNKFETFVGDLGNGTHDLRAAGDQLEVYLSNAAPSASADSVKADLAEISTGNGYTGPQDVQQDYTEASGTGTLTGVDVTITASGGSVGPFQYVVLQNTTPSSPLDPLIAWWDYGSALTLNDGESFTVDFGASIFTLT